MTRDADLHAAACYYTFPDPQTQDQLASGREKTRDSASSVPKGSGLTDELPLLPLPEIPRLSWRGSDLECGLL